MRLLLLAVAGSLALSGCHGKTDPPGAAPTGVTPKAGDGLAVIQWDTLPDLTYWIFYEPGSTVAVATPESIAIRRALSPRVVTNLANGLQYAFVMNATRDDSAAGPNSLPVFATPRLAGKDWVPGKPLGTPPQNLRSMVFTGARFVAVGDAATIFAGDLNYTNVDPPGVTVWTPPTLPTGFAANLTSVIFNGTFVALGEDGSIILSADGITWTSAGSVGAAGMLGLTFGFLPGSGVPTYVAVGTGGRIFVGSADLTTWTPAPSGTTNDLNSIAVVNGVFTITGSGGTLLVSQNGTQWTSQVSNTTNTLRSVAFNPLLPIHYAAVGDAGTVIVSTDGVTDWTPIAPPPVPQDLRSVTVGGASGTRFLAVGLNGAVVHSDDGMKWDVASSGTSNLAKAIFTSGMYLAVGDAGANVVAQ